MLRTHTCGELSRKDEKKEVTLCGWVHSVRPHGNLNFIDLKDRYGITQIVLGSDIKESLREQDVIKVKGSVKLKPEPNPKLKTGEIEIAVSDLEILNRSEKIPLDLSEETTAGDEARLKYRFLDLRRHIMQKNLIIRHKVIKAGREYFNKNNFIEITTPMLVKSTPEGARDYVVPSRVNPGKFYALPQSPQLYKQILMIAGFDRYFQTAICLRDEDLRADRQPEHMQFDFEMSFVTSDDIRDFVEGLYTYIFKEVLNIKLEKFPVFTYKEAMDRFGTDKPDIRFGLELIDITKIVKESDFQVFKNAEKIKCLNPEKDFTRKELDDYTKFCQKNGAKGMVWIKVTDKGLDGSIVKFLKPELQKKLLEATKAKKDSALMCIADKPKVVADILGKLRLKIRDDLKLVKPNEFKCCFVKDFPLFAWNEEENRWEPEHHMFTMPKPEFVDDFEERPTEVIGDLWDFVINGWEIASGSIRVSVPEIQERIMKFIGMSKEKAYERFGFLLDAYKYGGPPHGGMGLGLDRTVALIRGLGDIREVIAFPKNKAAECPMDSSPSEIDDNQLDELHIKTDITKKKNQVLEEIKDMLHKEKIEFEIIEHEPVFTCEEAAKARNTKIELCTKSLVLKADDKFIMALIAGNKIIDLLKLKKIIKAKNLDLAAPSKVLKLTNCSPGSVPPFGNLFNLDVYVDESIKKNEFIYFNAGSHTTSIKISSKALINLIRPKIVNISK
ncbi:aspartate--tRNA ligase [Candidatus Woesearchaeota archaeon]|nr:aspartate--tRNA ligase [Candidatus Woesearchaeota archaeon]